MVEPLRIGILGASRVAELSIVKPAAVTGHRLVAVAARDPQRAKAFAERHGVEGVHATYEDLLEDPEVEVVSNPLANSLHGPWNLRAIEGDLPRRRLRAPAVDAASLTGPLPAQAWTTPSWRRTSSITSR